MYPERPSRDLTILRSEVDIDNDARVRETSLAAVTEVPLLSGRTVKRLCNFHSQRRRTNIKYVHRNRLCLIPLPVEPILCHNLWWPGTVCRGSG